MAVREIVSATKNSVYLDYNTNVLDLYVTN